MTTSQVQAVELNWLCCDAAEHLGVMKWSRQVIPRGICEE